VPLTLASEWLLRRFGDNDTWQAPASLVYLIVVAWTIAASGRVLHAALEWPMA
jgi:hypothetical protein